MPAHPHIPLVRRLEALRTHRELRAGSGLSGLMPLPADVRRLVRMAGTGLAIASLALAFAAAAQGPVYDGGAHMGGVLPWIFAAFAAAAVLGIFAFVLWLVHGPSSRPPGTPPPGHAR